MKETLRKSTKSSTFEKRPAFIAVFGGQVKKTYMKCESCKIKEIDIEVSKNDGMEGGIWDADPNIIPYKLCSACHKRLKTFSFSQ